MRIDVEFGAAGEGEAAPVAVRFGERRLAVTGVADRWYGRDRDWWKLDTEGGTFILRRDHADGAWSLAAVPAAAEVRPTGPVATGGRPH